MKHIDDLFDVDHPLDLSFTKDINYGQRQKPGLTGYASDNEGKAVKSPMPADDDFKSSIISSDDSIAAKINALQPGIEDDLNTTEKKLTKTQKKQNKI